MNSISTSSRVSRDLVAYFILSFAISWSIAIPLALAHNGIIPEILPHWTYYLVAYGPMLSALIVTGIRQGAPGLKEIGARMTRWRVALKWWLVGFSPLIIGYVVILLLNRFGSTEIGLSTLGAVHYLPPLGTGALLLWFITFGIGEETGWRGFALPRLEKGRSALAATLILTTFWALWHLPLFFFLFDPSIAVGWAIGLLAGSLVFTWLYNSAGNSILIVAVFHACFNFMTASTADTGALPIVLSVLVMIWAVLVIVIYRPRQLLHGQRVIK